MNWHSISYRIGKTFVDMELKMRTKAVRIAEQAISYAGIQAEKEKEKEAKKADLLVVALKYNALLKALPSIKEAVGENTIVMSLMNGVDSEEIIAKEVGEPHVLYSVIKIASHKEKTGFYLNPETTIGIISSI